MLRQSLFLLVVVIWSGYLVPEAQSSRMEASTRKQTALEGAYEFISETTNLVEPERLNQRRSSPEWVGLWLFQDGRFSQTLMKQGRDWPTFPRELAELDYESSAGTYKIEGKMISLKPELTLSPVDLVYSPTFEYRLQGDTLTLTETMIPYMEDLSKGKRVTILRRIK